MLQNQHCKPLSPGDALFLYLEREGVPLSIAGICEFEGTLSFSECIPFIQSKLPLIPRYRQRIVMPPFDFGLPRWEFDPDFDINNHVREVTLKRGTERDFKNLVGRIMSTRLRRDRPLWDFTVVQGLKSGRTGVVIRIHHCLADGISGVGLMQVLLDPSPRYEVPTQQPDAFHAPPVRQQSLAESLISSCLTSIERVLEVQADVLQMARQFIASQTQIDGLAGSTGVDPTTSAVAALDELGQLIPEFGSPTERLPFNIVGEGPQKFDWTHISLADVKAVKNVCETTINDVILSLFGSAVRRYSEQHGVRLKNRVLRAMVPVNIRGNGDVGELGNRITFLPVNIPLDISDPVKHLHAVRRAVARARKARMAELIGLVGSIVASVPTPLQAMLLPMASKLPLSLCNTVCTNVPGPTVPLYLLGRKMTACYPYVPIGGEMGLNCAVLSYNGNVYFGLSGFTQAIPDLKNLQAYLDASFSDLRKAAGIAPTKSVVAKRKTRAGRKSRKPARMPAAAQVQEDVRVSDQAPSPELVEDNAAQIQAAAASVSAA